MNSIFYKIRKAAIFCALMAGAGGLHAQCTAPTTVTATVRACDSIGATWTAVPGVINYTYAVNNSPTPPTAGSVAATNNVEVGNLSQGSLYYVHVKANCFGTVSGWTTGSVTTCGTYCPPVANFLATTTSNSTTATWTASAGALGYEYKLDQSTGNPTTGILTTTATTVTVSGLTGGTSYYWHIRTKCGPTTYSAWRVGYLAATTGFDPNCTPPASVGVTIRRCDSVTMNWAAIPGAAMYNAGVTLAPFTGPSGSLMVTPNTTAEWGQAMAASTKYIVHVRNDCGLSKGAFTLDSFTTPACPVGGSCVAVAAVTVNIASCDSVGLVWTYAGSNRNYNYAVTTSATPPATGVYASTYFNAGVGGLLPSTQYYAHVRTNCRGSNAWKTQPFITPACGGTICTAPAAVTPSAITANSATLTWTAAASATGYEYAMNTSATAPAGSGTAVTTLTQNLTGLSAATAYYFHLRTKCGATSFSTWKSTPVTTTGGTGICLAPATVTNGAITATTANISWASAANALSYEYVINQTVTNPTTAGTAVAGTTVALTGLTPNTNYYWHLRSKCGTATFSPWKAATQVITPRGTGISNTASGNSFFSLYPNPAGSTLTVELSRHPGKDAEISIYSIDGRKVKTLVPALNTTIDIHELQSGLYFLRYAGDGQVQEDRFIKQ